VGGLGADVAHGDVVVPDQLVDRTHRRVQSFVEAGAVHVPFADPYCGRLGAAVTAADPAVLRGGTMVVVEGPRFSTRAESQHYAAQRWSLVNMTGHPEAVLARELALCYAAIALVTDRDAGVGVEDAVSQVEVFAEFARNVDRLRALLAGVIEALPEGRSDCDCAQALDGLPVPFELP
jgi:5'-methylthioadenosine phosphorylase